MASEQKGRIKSRPNAQRNLGSTTTGLRRTGIETDRDGLLYVPESFNPKSPSPLVVMLHGAEGDAEQAIQPLQDFADRTGTILLAPESQASNWDLFIGGFGVDIYFMDEALMDVFALYPIDPKKIALAGFAEGAAYALSVSAANADLFSHVMAFSPPFAETAGLKNLPPTFISHGTRDEVLLIDDGGRQLAPKLKAAGVDVSYQEFDGGNTLPSNIVQKAFSWFLGKEVSSGTTATKAKGSETRNKLT